MKKILLSLLIMALTQACGKSFAVEPESDEYKMSCKFLNTWDFLRCENEEVVCYQIEGVGLSCKWK